MPASIWTLNGATLDTLDLAAARLDLVNQQADTLSLVQTLAPDAAGAQLPAPLYAYGDQVTLARDGVTWFVGKIRSVSSAVDRQRTLVARGAWDVLERKAYLQTFKAAADPSDEASTLINVVRGRVVLGQNDAGLRVDLATFLGGVISYAGLTPGDIDTAVTVPYEDATDLSCAEVITRLLRWIPGSVVSFDYTTSPATCHIRTRASLVAAAIGLSDPALQHPLQLTPRQDLVVNHVALFYLSTNRENAAAWETVEEDFYPEGTTGTEDGALVRTIQLAGSVSSRSYLTQRVETAIIPPELTTTALVTSGTEFTALSAWWKEHRPELAKANVTIKGFRSGARIKTDGDPVTADLRELKSGGLADWMRQSGAPVSIEQQLVEVDVVYELATGAIDTSKQVVMERLTAQIYATNAQTKTYTQLADASFSAGEEVPTGLAEALYNALHPLQWEGEVNLVEAEPTDWPRPGHKVSITGTGSIWADMAAVVQRRTTDLQNGATTITLGPPSQIEPDGLVNIYRTNRNRQPSTSYLVRATGRSGGSSGAGAAPLPIAQPILPAQSSTRVAPRVFTQALSVAGSAPTATEVTTALAAAFATEAPISGDVVNLTVGGVTKLRATVSAHGTTSGIFAVSFTVGGVTWYAYLVQVGLY